MGMCVELYRWPKFKKVQRKPTKTKIKEVLKEHRLGEIGVLEGCFINKMINIQKLRQHSQNKNRNAQSPIHFRITQLACTSTEKFIHMTKKSHKASCTTIKRHYSCEKKVYDRPHSNTVTLFFNENTVAQKKKSFQLLKIADDAPTDKIYHTKKKNYSRFLKETRVKIKSNASNEMFNIQSRPLSLINFNQTLFYKDANLITRKRKSITQNKHVSQPQQTEDSHIQQVVVIEPKELSKLQKKAFKSFIGVSRSQKREETNKTFQSKEHVSNEKNNTILARIQSEQSEFSDKNVEYQSFIPFKKTKERRKPFTFALFEKQNKVNIQNQIKMLNYKDFLWKINYSNGLNIRPASNQQITFKVYVGFGNNDALIRNAMKRRFWWSFSQNIEESHFVWTQLKLGKLFSKQSDCSCNFQRVSSVSAEQEAEIDAIKEKSKSHYKIFNVIDMINWVIHEENNKKSERIVNQKTYKNRIQFISYKQIKTIESSSSLVIHNHFDNNGYIGNKKALFYNLKKYYEMQQKDVFQVIPLTFHITRGIQDQQWIHFQNQFKHFQKQKEKGVFQNIWILKPGQNSNRGNGITVCYDFEDIRLRLKEKQRNKDGSLRTFIIQKYIQRPLLYNDRKFDIRHYLLMTCINGNFKAYWYNEGYIRTSSSFYTLKRGSNIFIHLTNDAIQKNSQDYSKYEAGNKISYDRFSKYVKELRNQNQSYFYEVILPQMRHIATEAVKSTFLSLDTDRKMHNFQLFGMDYMIDSNYKPWLIQINTNPCLELSCPLLSKIIPTVVEQTIQLCVDPLFPPPNEWTPNKGIEVGENLLQRLNFELIFDQQTQGEDVKKLLGAEVELMKARIGRLDEESQTFQNQQPSQEQL